MSTLSYIVITLDVVLFSLAVVVLSLNIIDAALGDRKFFWRGVIVSGGLFFAIPVVHYGTLIATEARAQWVGSTDSIVSHIAVFNADNGYMQALCSLCTCVGIMVCVLYGMHTYYASPVYARALARRR